MSKPDPSFHTALGALQQWFERQKRVLPWREQPTIYRVWISEIMLQQTQVATVVPYFERFVARFPDVESLAQAPEDEVLLHWAGLGYYSRARNLHKGAQKILRDGFPRTREGWLEIPGVGDYTAGAVLSIALDQSEAILDGNVERVLSRIRRVNRKRGDAAYKARLWRLSEIFVTRGTARKIRPSVLNQALMELGATVCVPKRPRCQLCPLQAICRAQAAGEQELFPPRKAPKTWLRVREEVHCLLDREGRIYVQKKNAGEWRAGLWDFPGQPPEPGLQAEPLGEIETRHVVTRHKISRVTRVWRVKRGWQAAESDGSLGRWIRSDFQSPGNAPEVPIGSALKRTVLAIRERYPEAWPEN